MKRCRSVVDAVCFVAIGNCTAMEAKYICAELPAAMGTCFGAVIFPNFMAHSDVARGLGVKPTSAGMCRRDADGKWYGYGHSSSLGVAYMNGDNDQLNKLGAE